MKKLEKLERSDFSFSPSSSRFSSLEETRNDNEGKKLKENQSTHRMYAITPTNAETANSVVTRLTRPKPASTILFGMSTFSHSTPATSEKIATANDPAVMTMSSLISLFLAESSSMLMYSSVSSTNSSRATSLS